MTETQGTKSSFTLTKEPCSGLTAEGKQCQRGAVRQADDERWWCGLHDPEKKAEREAKKAERKQEIVAEEKAEEQIQAETEVKATLVDEVVVAAEKAMNALNSIAFMRDTGWPVNTHAEKYKVLLKEANSVALKAAGELRDDIAKIKKQLQA